MQKDTQNSTNIDIMLVFDIDGVLTNPHEMTFNDYVFDRIAVDLRQGIPVAFNTGRSTNWVFDLILPRLQARLDASAMKHLLLIAEKGGVRVEFTGDEPTVIEDLSIALPNGFIEEAPLLLDGPAGDGKLLSDYIFWDTKRTMASFEKRPEVPTAEYDQVRVRLHQELERLFKKYDLKDFHIDATVISTDVENKKAGKHKGAEQVLEWLVGRNEKVRKFYSFGDSPSDEVMAAVFAKDAESTFVYVGAKPLAEKTNDSHTRTIMHGRFDADTAEYLQNMQ